MPCLTSSSFDKRARASYFFLLYFWVLLVSCNQERDSEEEESNSFEFDKHPFDHYEKPQCLETVSGRHDLRTTISLQMGPNRQFENGLNLRDYDGSLTKFCVLTMYGGLSIDDTSANMAAYCDTSAVGLIGRGSLSFSELDADPQLWPNLHNRGICKNYCHCPDKRPDPNLRYAQVDSQRESSISEDEEEWREDAAWISFLKWVDSPSFSNGGSSTTPQGGGRTHHRPGYFSGSQTCQVKSRCQSFSCSGADRGSCSCKSRVVGGALQRLTCAGKKVDPRLYALMVQSRQGG